MTDSADSYFIQFGGQGTAWYPELSRYYREHVLNKNKSADLQIQEVILAGIETLRQELQRNSASPALNPYSADLHDWLSSDDAAPPEEYMERAPVSMPMIQLAQLCNLLALGTVNRRLTLENLYNSALAATGHSQGLITAVLFSLKLTGDSFIEAVRYFTRFQFYLGLRAQEYYPFPSATESEKKRADETGAGGPPSPMAAVLGLTTDDVRQLTEVFNSKRTDLNNKVFISLYNTPSNHILSGSRNALMDFYSEYRDVLTAARNNFVFLKATCPFHSPYLYNSVTLFEEDLSTMPFPYSASEMKIPVYSFSDGINFQESVDPALKLAHDVIRRVLYWDKPYRAFLKSFADLSDHVVILDFGPGRVTQKLSGEVISALRISEKIPFSDVYCAAYPKDLRKLAEI